MLLWQCGCGWAGARTVAAAEEAREEARERRTQSGTAARVHIELEDERKKA
jgi:hypothetical protein